MAKGDWWFKFEIPVWRNSPELRRCSLQTRGFWIDCIAIMRDTETATITGTCEDFARVIGCFPSEVEKSIQELKRNKTAVVTQKGEIFTVMSRRYAKELKIKEQNRIRKQRERGHAKDTPESRDKEKSKSNKKEVREENTKAFSSGGEAQAPARPQGKSQPLSKLWQPDPQDFAWGAEKFPKIDLMAETEKMRLHYFGTGDGRADWGSVWRKWIIKAEEILIKENKNGQSNNHNGSKPTPAEIIAGRTRYKTEN